MKRLWILSLALCLTALFCAGTLGLGAEEANPNIWNVYSAKTDPNGTPIISIPPRYEYNGEGLRVTPLERMVTYTVQTEHAFSMDDGVYMEVKLDEPVELGVMVFSLWDQSGMMLGNYHCGSGWQGSIQLDPSSDQFFMSSFMYEAKGPLDNGSISILGTMKVGGVATEDGGVIYALSIKDGALSINGIPVVGTEEIMTNLRGLRPDGSVYFGVTMNMTGWDDGIPMTITRFGTSKETAAIPGTGGSLPDTGDDVPTTEAPKPTETEPPAEDTTSKPAPDTRPNGGEDTLPPEPESETDPSAPTETETEYDPFGDPPDMTTEKYDPPFAEKETETRREIKDEAVDNMMEKLEGCTSTLGMGALALTATLAAAYVCVRKKDRTE